MVGVGEVVSQVNLGLEGVNESVDDRVKYHNRQRVSLVDSDLKGDGRCNPVLCDDFPSKIRVERLEDILELGKSVIVSERVLDESVMDTPICIG